jgi:hypothetical protein
MCIKVMLKHTFDLCTDINILHRIPQQIAYHANVSDTR